MYDFPKALGRYPDFVIGSVEDPYLLRWFIIPKNPIFNIYLHCFCRSDDDRALHDHPWLFNISILLKGEYIEHTFKKEKLRDRGFSRIKFRFGPAPHRVELLEEIEPFIPRMGINTVRPRKCWTIFITGPKVREWGFYCPKGWRHWREFVSLREGGNDIGRGCE